MKEKMKSFFSNLNTKEGQKNLITIILWVITLIFLFVFVGVSAAGASADILAIMALLFALFLVSGLLFIVFDKYLKIKKENKKNGDN